MLWLLNHKMFLCVSFNRANLIKYAHLVCVNLSHNFCRSPRSAEPADLSFQPLTRSYLLPSFLLFLISFLLKLPQKLLTCLILEPTVVSENPAQSLHKNQKFDAVHDLNSQSIHFQQSGLVKQRFVFLQDE